MYRKFYKYNGLELELKKENTEEDMSFGFGSSYMPVPNPNEVITVLEGDDTFNSSINAKEKSVMENGIQIIKEISHIYIDEIVVPTNDFKIFKDYSEENHNALCESIKSNGLFSPIIVWETRRSGEVKYLVISGIERWKAYCSLYLEAGEINDEVSMSKYEKIPCFLMGMDELTEIHAKQIYIESNLCTRTIDGETRVKAYSQYYMILKYFKDKRNEYNILDEMASKFRVSKQTIHNYLSLQKLISPLMYLFQEKILNLKSALLLARFKEEYQELILNTLGFNNITNAKVSVLKVEKMKRGEKDLLSLLKIAKNIKYPYKSSVRINMPTKHLEEFIPELNNFLRKFKKFFVKLVVPRIRV